MFTERGVVDSFYDFSNGFDVARANAGDNEIKKGADNFVFIRATVSKDVVFELNKLAH